MQPVLLSHLSVADSRLTTSKDSSVKTLVGKFSFKVPEGHELAGQKIEKAFEFPETESVEEAQNIIETKKWNIKDMVDEVLKANARSNAYQTATLPYRPSEVPAEDIKERMIRDYIRLGISEDVARKQVEAMLGTVTP